jgi:hypothetical protein
MKFRNFLLHDWYRDLMVKNAVNPRKRPYRPFKKPGGWVAIANTSSTIPVCVNHPHVIKNCKIIKKLRVTPEIDRAGNDWRVKFKFAESRDFGIRFTGVDMEYNTILLLDHQNMIVASQQFPTRITGKADDTVITDVTMSF